MQPRDFHEEVANSAERVKRNRKRLETLRRKHYIESLDTTPPYCPRPMVLVQDTQPRSEVRNSKTSILDASQLLTIPKKKRPFENVLGKGAFCPFPTMFSILSQTEIII